MLAAQLAAEGYQPVVIDCYGDEDMRAVATDFRRVRDLSLHAIEAAFEQLVAYKAFSGVIYGSGLERHLDTLAFLQWRCTLLGNPLEVVRALQQKKDFFKRLDHFSIPHPAVQFTPPAITENWLFKPEQGEGGVGVKWAEAVICSGSKGYWQQFVPGTPMSVLFLASRKQVQIIGFHRQITECHDDLPFLFAGVETAQNQSSQQYRRQIQTWLDLLVNDYGLVGLNSLDFIWAENRPWLLEINARPSASLQLYSSGWVRAHIEACLGKSPEVRYNSKIYGGYKIVFADRVFRIPERFCWPDGVFDRPVAGTVIETGQPLCSLSVVDEQSTALVSGLAVKERRLIDYLIAGGACNFEQV